MSQGETELERSIQERKEAEKRMEAEIAEEVAAWRKWRVDRREWKVDTLGELADGGRASMSAFEKSVTTIATGMLGLSFATVSFGEPTPELPWLLYAAWLVFGIALAAVMTGQGISAHAHDEQYNSMKDWNPRSDDDPPSGGSKWNWIIKASGWTAGIGVLVGLTLFSLSIALTYMGPNDEPKEPERDTPAQVEAARGEGQPSPPADQGSAGTAVEARTEAAQEVTQDRDASTSPVSAPQGAESPGANPASERD